MGKALTVVIKLIIIVPAALCLALCFFGLNAGLLVGILLFGGIIAATLFHKRLFAAVKWLCGRVWGKLCLLVAGALLILCAGAAVFFSVNIASHVYKPADRVDVVIVLGCRVKGETPSSLLAARCYAAAEVMKSHREAVCIVSGGQGSGEDISEALAMQRLMIQYGIDENRVYMEDKSTSTAENFAFSVELMRREGISGKVAVVTSDFHQYRASLYAQRCGLTDTAHYSGGTHKLYKLNYWLREWAALAATYVFGY